MPPEAILELIDNAEILMAIPAWLIPLLIAGGSALLGGRRSPDQTQSQNTSFDNSGTSSVQGFIDKIFDTFETRTRKGKTTTTTDQKTQPFAIPGFENLTGLMKDFAERRAVSQPDVRGITARQVAGTNRSFDQVNQALTNAMAERGSAAPPGDAAAAVTGGARAGSIADILGQAPLQERRLEDQGAGIASSILEKFGTGVHQKGIQETITDMVETLARKGSERTEQDLTTTSSSSGTGVGAGASNAGGGGLMGGISGLLQALMFLMGQGSFNRK